MRLVRQIVILGLVGLASLVVSGPASAQTNTCTGNHVIETAPYGCTETKVINGITFSITLTVDATGRATVDYVMSPVQQADVPISVHSYTNISSDPRQFIDGVILAGQTTAQIVVPRIECGQLDMKAVFITPGDAAGNIAGPVVTWGEVCQAVPTTVAPTTTPSSVSPSSVSPSSVRPTIPSTGTAGVLPWVWSLPAFALAAVLIAASRWRRPSAG
jgi:hypothetical protein